MLAGALAWVSALALGSAPARASRTQVAIIQDDLDLLRDPAGTLERFRALGADSVRVFVKWSEIAPQPNSVTRPAGFDASDPGSYPDGSWTRWDAIDRDAQGMGMVLDFVLSGGAPRWAEGPAIPAGALGNPSRAWKPSASAFGAFVRAVATRYSGRYPDPQNPDQFLPRISFWSIWNEPNFGQDLAPQAEHGSTVLSAPRMYRALLDSAWGALSATGHGRDTVVIGELAPSGESGPANRKHPLGLPGNFAMTKPVTFAQALYCLDRSYRPLTGAAARALGCPTSRSATRSFRSRHPALFRAGGFSDHPYMGHEPPNARPSHQAQFAAFPDLRRFEHDLDLIQRAYGSHRRFAIYDDEFGYITHPPSIHRYPSPATAAGWINWVEYLSWRDPRIASTSQYLLNDPLSGGFDSGLLTAAGSQKPAFASYRLPIYLPRTSARRGSSREVWGCVRPARYAALDTGSRQSVQIQLRPRGARAFATVRAVRITNARGYFDTRVKFARAGTVRLAWSYPPGDGQLDPGGSGTVYSRSVSISAR